jgi:hypothetical protein
LFEAKWTELPTPGDTVNLSFVSRIVGESTVTGGSVVCRAPNSYPLNEPFRAVTVADLV